MNRVIIHKNPNGDTRTAPKGITYEQFQVANDSHRDDVNKVISALSLMLSENGVKHDWTKKEYEKMFTSTRSGTICCPDARTM